MDIGCNINHETLSLLTTKLTIVLKLMSPVNGTDRSDSLVPNHKVHSLSTDVPFIFEFKRYPFLIITHVKGPVIPVILKYINN